MSAQLPWEVTKPWESDCRRCRQRVLHAFGPNGYTVVLDAAQVYGGDVELMQLEVGLRAKQVTAAGDVERYTQHQCPNAPKVDNGSGKSGTGDDVRAARYTVMPFGKHRGEYLDDVPNGYLRWALDNCEFREERIRQAIEVVLHIKEGRE